MVLGQKELLYHLSKEQLVYLIEQLNHSQFLIGETCVDESKCHIDAAEAVDKIRKYLYYVPSMWRTEDLSTYLDMKMGKISVSEYRKIIGLDD